MKATVSASNPGMGLLTQRAFGFNLDTLTRVSEMPITAMSLVSARADTGDIIGIIHLINTTVKKENQNDRLNLCLIFSIRPLPSRNKVSVVFP